MKPGAQRAMRGRRGRSRPSELRVWLCLFAVLVQVLLPLAHVHEVAAPVDASTVVSAAAVSNADTEQAAPELTCFLCELIHRRGDWIADPVPELGLSTLLLATAPTPVPETHCALFAVRLPPARAPPVGSSVV
jgi:hypothetical protein